jgi:hypothetical protein
MKLRSILTVLAVAILSWNGGMAVAQETEPAPNKTPVRSKGTPRPKPRQAAKVPVSKRIDINSASKDQLKTLPGITDEYADKIIAGRPYLTRTRLASQNVLPFGVYQSISGLITAVPPKSK